jgi:hypothetical protein
VGSYSLWYVRELGPWLVIAALALFVLALASRRAIDRPALALTPVLAIIGILSQAAARGDAFHFPQVHLFRRAAVVPLRGWGVSQAAGRRPRRFGGFGSA